MRGLPSSYRRIVAAALALSLLPSCSVKRLVQVQAPPDGVTVKALTADLAFGAEEAAQAIGPVTLVPDTGSPIMEPLLDPFGLDLGVADTPAAFGPPPTSVMAAPQPCPEADQSAVSAREATQTVEGTPRPGVYRWKQEGTIELPGLAKIPLPPLSTRTFRNVTAADGAVTYEYEQITLAGRETQFVSVRNDGVFLTRLQIAGGGQVLDFNPLIPLKLYSLPVRPGEPIAEQGVDLSSRLLVSINGQVGGRERLDACGELLDAWVFKGRRTIEVVGDSARSIRSTTFDTWLAPQFGGLLVGDRVATQGSFGPLVYTLDATTNIGGLAPVRPA